MSALLQKADIERHDWQVRFVPKAVIHWAIFRKGPRPSQSPGWNDLGSRIGQSN